MPIASLVHRLWIVLLFYGVTVFVSGVLVSVVFQLAHCVGSGIPPCLAKDLLRLKKPGRYIKWKPQWTLLVEAGSRAGFWVA